MIHTSFGLWTAAALASVAFTVPDVAPGQHPYMASTVIAPAARAVPVQSGNVLHTKVTVQLKNVTLERALLELERQVRTQFVYSDANVPLNRRVSVSGSNISLEAALAQAFVGTRTVARVSESGQLVITQEATGKTQLPGTGIVAGKVLHAKTKQPVAGVTITVNGSDAQAVTGADGTFRLQVPAGDQVLRAKGIGFVAKSQSVSITADHTTTLELMLESSASVLDEVVVTGTVIATERKAITTPITVITADEIEKRGITRLEQLFRGEIPGVYAQEQGSQIYIGGNPGAGLGTLGGTASTAVFVRGSSNLGTGVTGAAGVPNPLKTYIDGVEIANPAYLGTIDPQSIERIEIVTGPQAATIYGSGAMGGVMQIFTKKGAGNAFPDLTLNLRYGMLESNQSTGRTPQHNHSFGVSGGTGPEFSYSGTVSYNYSGEWVPGLFRRDIGVSGGVSHERGPVTISGSVSTTTGRNGTVTESGGLAQRQYRLNGEWAGGTAAYWYSSRIHTSESQTASVSATYRPFPMWQNTIVLGKTQTEFSLIPQAPKFTYLYDTLYAASSSTGSRTTLSYNTTILPPALGFFATTITLGANTGSSSRSEQFGCLTNKTSTSFITCVSGWTGGMGASQTRDHRTSGAFGAAQITLFGQIHFSTGVRMEHDPAYGRERKIDWTPTNGVTYTFDMGAMSIKALASYGRATRAPSPEMRLEQKQTTEFYEPREFISQFESPLLTPEYSRGPQGGIEIYYGNRGSLTVNRYVQTISDLIQNVAVDSFQHYPKGCPECPPQFWTKQYQNLNVAEIRQHGWETTVSMNLWALNVKGAYTWADSRVRKSSLRQYYPGMSFLRLPTHMGNIMVSYAFGGTNVTLSTNFSGESLQWQDDLLIHTMESRARLQMYIGRWWYFPRFQWAKAGYAKSDLSASQRITPWASATLNIVNLGNSFGTDVSPLDPALGRQTSIGISLRSPRR